MKNLLFFIILIIPNLVFADLLEPSPDLTPEEVILIQLKALSGNFFQIQIIQLKLNFQKQIIIIMSGIWEKMKAKW